MHSRAGRFGTLAGAWVLALVVQGIAAEPRTIEYLQLKLMPIPAGNFLMGSPAGEAGRGRNEAPQTHVTLTKPFWMGQTEVTYGQWRAVMETELSEQVRRAITDDTIYDISGRTRTVREYYNIKKETEPVGLLENTADDSPMYWVSWEEAVEFCRRLNERERAANRLPAGYEYRLPTEAEWEYACRAGTTTATYAGDLEIVGRIAAQLDKIAWYNGNNSDGWTGKGRAGQRTVATKAPNAWGLHDTLGNLWEWCADWYIPTLPGGEVRDPTGPALGTQRVSRGGAWNFAATGSRAARRFQDSPGARFRCVGFRVALAPELPR